MKKMTEMAGKVKSETDACPFSIGLPSRNGQLEVILCEIFALVSKPKERGRRKGANIDRRVK